MGGVYVWDERLPNYGTRILNGDLAERQNLHLSWASSTQRLTRHLHPRLQNP